MIWDRLGFPCVLSTCGCAAQPEHAWGTGQLEICTLLENGRGMSGPELENLFHLGHARKHRERIDIDNAIYAHFGVLSADRPLSAGCAAFTDHLQALAANALVSVFRR